MSSTCCKRGQRTEVRARTSSASLVFVSVAPAAIPAIYCILVGNDENSFTFLLLTWSMLFTYFVMHYKPASSHLNERGI